MRAVSLPARTEVETIEFPDDAEGPVVATLIRVPAERVQPTIDSAAPRRAMLHVHGFNDYFFHAEYAAWWNERDYDVYGIDLRKYGRSLLPHQTPHYCEDLREYFADLDAVWERIVAQHDQIVVSAHSTGGLIVALWLNERGHTPAGLVLNSPWFDLRASTLQRVVGTTVVDRVGARQPRRILAREANDVYGRSLHRDHGGEWDFDLVWKTIDPRPIYFGWLRAIRRGHAELHAGLGLQGPSLVLTSSATASAAELDDVARSHDLVLDVEQIRRWSPSLGGQVTICPVEGAIHDVVLSAPEVRAVVYDKLDRWLRAWVE